MKSRRPCVGMRPRTGLPVIPILLWCLTKLWSSLPAACYLLLCCKNPLSSIACRSAFHTVIIRMASERATFSSWFTGSVGRWKQKFLNKNGGENRTRGPVVIKQIQLDVVVNLCDHATALFQRETLGPAICASRHVTNSSIKVNTTTNTFLSSLCNYLSWVLRASNLAAPPLRKVDRSVMGTEMCSYHNSLFKHQRAHLELGRITGTQQVCPGTNTS